MPGNWPICPAPILRAAIAEYEQIQEVLGRVASYAQLLFAGDSSDAAIGRFYQTVNERVTAIGSDLIFFALELNRLDDAALEGKFSDPALARYRPWLRDLRVFRPHQLSDDLEKLTHERDLTAHAAWVRLFDETVASMRIQLAGETLTVSDTLNKLSGSRPLGFAKLPARRSARRSATIFGYSPSSPTPWPRTRRSRTPGATMRVPPAIEIGPTWWRTRS